MINSFPENSISTPKAFSAASVISTYERLSNLPVTFILLSPGHSGSANKRPVMN